MKLLPYIAPSKIQYTLIPTRKLIFEFNTSGFSIFHSILSTQVYCFDDLGLELTAKHYGEQFGKFKHTTNYGYIFEY